MELQGENMNVKKVILNSIIVIALALSAFGSTIETQASSLVESCEPFATAGTPFISGGEVRTTNSVFCQTGVSTGVTFFSTIKVFRKSDHTWLYDTVTKSQSCTAPCSVDYDPNLAYNSAYSYYTWVKVTVNGTSQFDTAASGWLNY